MTDDINRYMLMMEAFAELKAEMGATHPTKPIYDQPTLEQTLTDFGPMPDEALFLGVATDELPVLLNLHDSTPGPLLITGDPGTGKTTLLQMIAHAATRMHQPEKLQFGILTNHPEEWSELNEAGNNIGIFPIQHKSSEDFILSLTSWAHGNKSSKQSILLLLDDLESVSKMDMDAMQNLRWLLLCGPSRRVWPIITLSTHHLDQMEPWLDTFHTRIFGNIQNPNNIQKLGATQADLNTLINGSEFALREGNHWIRFRSPALNK